MSVIAELNSLPLYLICGAIIAFVAVICVVFIVRAYKAGVAMGMDEKVLKRVVTSSATFSILPGVGILLGVIALSGSLGLPWPWLRLSVIGALHYEAQVAQAAAEHTGIGTLNPEAMTASAFATIALLMSICIMWGMVLSVLFNRGYLKKIGIKNPDQNETSLNKKSGFGDMAMSAMFIGLVSAYIGSYIGSFVSSDGLFSFRGDYLPLIVVFVSGLVMAIFVYLSEKKKKAWVDNFSVAASMLIGMTSAVLINLI